MYKITTPTGETYLTDTLTYIRKHPSGAYLITDQRRAEGVAYHGLFFLFEDGASIQKVDAADVLAKAEQAAALEEETKMLNAQVTALTDQNDFQEELIVELANIIYA